MRIGTRNINILGILGALLLLLSVILTVKVIPVRIPLLSLLFLGLVLGDHRWESWLLFGYMALMDAWSLWLAYSFSGYWLQMSREPMSAGLGCLFVLVAGLLISLAGRRGPTFFQGYFPRFLSIGFVVYAVLMILSIVLDIDWLGIPALGLFLVSLLMDAAVYIRRPWSDLDATAEELRHL